MSIPSTSELPLDERGYFRLSWRRFFDALDRQATANGTGTSDLAAAISTIATALGSPDGSVDTIPEQSAAGFVIVSPSGTLSVIGTPASGSVAVALQRLEDSGVGDGLYKITRDGFGRVAGTEAATTDDLAEGSNLYFTDERAQDAVAAMIAAGTHTGITFTYDDANNKISAAVSGGGGGGAVSLVGTVTVTGSAATSLTMTGLDLATDGCYIIHAVLKNAAASAANVALFYNSDTTATNYWEQVLSIDGTSVNAARGNDAFALSMDASIPVFAEVVLRRDLDGYPRSHVRNVRSGNTSAKIQLFTHVRNNTANVTSITLSSSVASSLAVGSFFKVFKLVG